LRIVLSNIGTFGDINPLIAIALELKRRGHVPVMALPNVYRPKIAPLGLEFRQLRPDIDPTNTKLVEMIYDVKKGTETGLREFLFPGAARDLRRPARRGHQARARRSAFARRAQLRRTRSSPRSRAFPGRATCWRRSHFSPHSIRPVLPPYPKLARADKAPGMGRVMRRLARFRHAQMAGAHLRAAPRTGIAEGQEPDLRRQALAQPGARALLARAGWSKRIGRTNTLITGFCFYDADAGNAALPAQLEEFLAAGEPPVVFTLGSAAVLAAGDFYEQSARAAKKLGVRAVLLVGTDPRNRAASPASCPIRFAWRSTRPTRGCFRAHHL
jgi:rhamnosyltransferase subunit B